MSLVRIFEQAKKRIHPFLPNDIEKFSSFFSSDPNSILQFQTLFPLFARYLSDSQAVKLRSAMMSGHGSAFMGSLSPCYKLRFFAGHKFCPRCAEEDFNNYGTTYWHVEHQVPGVSACFRHQCRLEGLCNDDRHLDRKLATPPINHTAVIANEKEVELASYAFSCLVDMQVRSVEQSSVQELLIKLSDLGFVTSSGNLRFTSLRTLLSEYWKGLSEKSFLGVPASVLSFDYLGPMLREKTRTPAHPIKFLLLSCWLEHYSSLEKTVAILPPVRTMTPDMDEIDLRILSMSQSGLSMNRIEAVAGVSRCYIRKVLELNGVRHATNSKRLPEALTRQVIIKGIYGHSIHAIAEQLSIKPSAVEHLLCRTAGLCAWRKHLWHQQKVIRAIENLKKARSLHPSWLRKDFKQHYSADFFLLYHHDKALLESLLPSKMQPRPPC